MTDLQYLQQAQFSLEEVRRDTGLFDLWGIPNTSEHADVGVNFLSSYQSGSQIFLVIDPFILLTIIEVP